MPGNTYINAFRSDEAKELDKHPMENHLLNIIARRASRTHKRTSGIVPGQALIGDYKNYGMTEQNYRTAKKNLEEWKYVTFKPTHKGTIATLCCPDVYDINIKEGNGQVTDSQRTGNGQVTTNKNIKNDKNIKAFDDFEKFPYLKDQEFKNNIKDFEELRNKKKKPMTERSRKMILSKLQKLDIKTANACLEKSIFKGWDDIYPEDIKNKGEPTVEDKIKRIKQEQMANGT